MVNTELLKKFYLFEGFTDAELQVIAQRVNEKEVIEGDYIFDEAAHAQAMYIIKSGTIEILKQGSEGEEQRLANLSTGSHFGEMAFVDHSPRAASAMVREGGKLLEIPYADLEQVLSENHEIGMKLYRNLALVLSRRIRQTTTDWSHLRELKLRHI